MALSFARFPRLWFSGKEKEQVPNGSGINSLSEWGVGFRGEAESVKMYSMTRRGMPPKRKWKSRRERIDREYDVVLVPSDGVSLSGSDSESDDPDWSIGWLEPHAANFRGDDDVDDGGDDSFAVLVPCYRNDCKKIGMPKIRAAKNVPVGASAGGRITWNSGFLLSRVSESKT